MFIRLMVFMIFVSLGGASAFADQVFIKNGDRLSGSIVDIDKNRHVALKTGFGQVIHIPWSQISALYDGANRPLTLSDSIQVTQQTPQIAETKSQTEPASTQAEQPIQTASMAPAVKKEDRWAWSGRANLGGSLDDGNSNSKALTFDGDIKVRDEKNRFSFGGEINWESDEGAETENDQMLYGEYDRFLNKKWFIGVRQRLEKDKFEALDLRSRTGLFTGYQFYEEDDLNLLAKIGADYISEDFEDDSSEDNMAGSWALDYDQKFFDAAFQLFHKHELSLPGDDLDAYLFDSASGLRVPVGQHLTGTFQVDFDWDNAPATNIREDDTSYSFKIGYEW